MDDRNAGGSRADGRTPTEIAVAWMEAAGRCDLAAIADGMADGCLRFGEPNWMVIGKTDYVASYERYLEAFSDYRLEIVNTLANGRTVVIEAIESATLTGPYTLPDGRVVQPNGGSYTDRVCALLEVDEAGRITEIRAYVPSTRARLMAEAIAASG